MGKWKTACMAAPSVLSSAVRRLGSLALAERRLGSLALAERRLGGLALAERRLFSLVLAVLLLAVPVLLGGCGASGGLEGTETENRLPEDQDPGQQTQLQGFPWTGRTAPLWMRGPGRWSSGLTMRQ